MKALVLYDSEFGNTARVAAAIADSLRSRFPVELASVSQAGSDQLAGRELLVVGGPTQHHGVSEVMRTWLDALPATLPGAPWLAVFDTRYRMPKIVSGSAAVVIGGRLLRRGARLLLPAESFHVTEIEGPLDAGETERAQAWAAQIVERLTERRHGPPAAPSR